MAQFKTLDARVLRSTALSEFTKHLDLEVNGVTRFGFVPGQWLSVKANTPDGEEMTRAYSIAPPPSENGHVAFCLNRVQAGFMSYYPEEFERLAAEHPNFHFLPTLSRAGPEWKGLRGYVQEHLAEIVRTRTDMHAYICGLDKMVKANRELLKSRGWDRTSIRYEKYD